eukprot:3629107-Amphidinium_carterae.3
MASNCESASTGIVAKFIWGYGSSRRQPTTRERERTKKTYHKTPQLFPNLGWRLRAVTLCQPFQFSFAGLEESKISLQLHQITTPKFANTILEDLSILDTPHVSLPSGQPPKIFDYLDSLQLPHAFHTSSTQANQVTSTSCTNMTTTTLVTISRYKDTDDQPTGRNIYTRTYRVA